MNFASALQNGETPVFSKIAGLFSELVAISKDGQLYQWKWSAEQPFSETLTLSKNGAINMAASAECSSSAAATPASGGSTVHIHHPKTLYLQLSGERIVGIATSIVRASVWTQSGKIASWLDEAIDIPYTLKFQTPAQPFTPVSSSSSAPADGQCQGGGESIVDMSTSNLVTVIKTSSGATYWWGLMPFEQRVKLIEKYQLKAAQKSSKSSSSSAQSSSSTAAGATSTLASSSSGSGSEITVGSLVSLKSLPVYSVGTIAFYVKDGQPRLGQLNEHVFAMRDASKAYKFRVKSADQLREAITSSLSAAILGGPQQQQETAAMSGLQTALSSTLGSLSSSSSASSSVMMMMIMTSMLPQQVLSQPPPPSPSAMLSLASTSSAEAGTGASAYSTPHHSHLHQQQQQQAPTGSLKRKKNYSSSESSSPVASASATERSGGQAAPELEESWLLSECVFVEDTKCALVLGKVIKVDADYVLVQMNQPAKQQADSDNTSNSELSLLDNSRIFPKNQLQLVKTSSSSSSGASSSSSMMMMMPSFYKYPDFMQKTPKKLPDFGGAVLAFCAQQNGLHAIIHKAAGGVDSSLVYIFYDLFSNKIVREKRFGGSYLNMSSGLGVAGCCPSSFLGANPRSIRLHSIDDANVSFLFSSSFSIQPLHLTLSLAYF